MQFQLSKVVLTICLKKCPGLSLDRLALPFVLRFQYLVGYFGC